MSQEGAAYNDEAAVVDGVGTHVQRPLVDVLALAALCCGSGTAPGAGPPRPRSLLDVGTGTGYTAALGAHLLGPGAPVVSLERDAGAHAHAAACLRRLSASRGGAFCAPTLRLAEAAAALAPGGAQYERVHVGGAVPREWLPPLLRLVAPGGRLIAPVDGQVRTRSIAYATHTGVQNHISALS